MHHVLRAAQVVQLACVSEPACMKTIAPVGLIIIHD